MKSLCPSKTNDTVDFFANALAVFNFLIPWFYDCKFLILKKEILTTAFCIIISWVHAQHKVEITGIILDEVTKKPLVGATVILNKKEKKNGVLTDTNGNFTVSTFDYGVFAINIQHLGYKKKEISDIALYDSKGVFLEILLSRSPYELDEVAVSAYKSPVESTDPLALVSARSISIEETKRFAGSLGDPSRMALSYAGVNNTRGDNNEIIIRGNSAKYLQWRLEGIEIPNPNHFGVYGSSGGLLSILNGDNLGRSNFYSGAFPAHTGNALAGVFDLSLRNGNATQHKHSIETGLIGLSMSSEGPLKFTPGSNYKVNYRYSTLGLMKNLGVFYQAPEYQDLTFKINLPSQKIGKFSVYGVAGLGTNLEEEFFRKIDSTQHSQNAAGKIIYGYDEIAAENLNRYDLGIFGVKHNIAIGNKSILTNHLNYAMVYSAPRSSGLNKDNFTTYLKQEGQFKTANIRYLSAVSIHLNPHNKIQSGIVFSFRKFDSKHIMGYPDFSTKTILKSNATSILGQSYFSFENTFYDKLKIITGFHYTFFSLNKQHILEPRIGMDYTLSEKSTIAFATGLHSTTESPEAYFIIEESGGLQSRNLKMSRSWQTVLSYKRALAEKLYFNSELYTQFLFDIPIAADSSNFSLSNAEVAFTDIPLVNQGKGLNYGIEITLEKFFSRSYYLLFTASLFQSEYKLKEAFYRKSKYNNGQTFNALGGKEFNLKKNRFLGVNTRVTFSGGKPYTPVLLAESIVEQREIRDVKRSYFSQLPPYIGIDLSMYYKWIKTKVSHEIKIDIFRLFEQNYYDERFITEKLNTDGSTTPALVKQLKYGEGQTASTILPVIYYKVNF